MVLLSVTEEVCGDNTGRVGSKHVLKDCVCTGNDGQSLKSAEQRNDVTSLSNLLLASDISVYLKT